MVRKAAKSKNKTNRQAKKHRAQRTSSRVHKWLSVVTKYIAKFPKSVRVPGMDHDIATFHAAAFVVLLGLAIGGGYAGAQALFGPQTTPRHTSAYAADFILPEPNGTGVHGTLAYEEKVAEEIYVAPDNHAADAAPPQIASLPPAQQAPQDLPHVQAPPLNGPLWMRNALPIAPLHPGPMISIVIDDMGVDRGRSRHMWEDVPGPLTLSFMTYADDLIQQTQAAKSAGHELMLHMSMEPSNMAIDPGPNVLLTAMSDSELKSIADWGMARFDGFVGVNNHMGSRFTEDPRAMRVVLERVKQKGVLFLDSRTSAKSVGRKVSREVGLPVLERNVFLDNENDVDKVRHQLDQVENLARKQGFAIAIGHPRDATIEVLKTWVPQAKARGLNIVPISSLMRQRLAAAEAQKKG